MQAIKLCDIDGCNQYAIVKCTDPECDLEVCEKHSRNGKCIYHIPVDEMKWDVSLIKELDRLLGL